MQTDADPFLDPAALLVFGAPGRAAITHGPDGRLTLSVEDIDGTIAQAVFDSDTKPALLAAIEALPSS